MSYPSPFLYLVFNVAYGALAAWTAVLIAAAVFGALAGVVRTR